MFKSIKYDGYYISQCIFSGNQIRIEKYILEDTEYVRHMEIDPKYAGNQLEQMMEHIVNFCSGNPASNIFKFIKYCDFTLTNKILYETAVNKFPHLKEDFDKYMLLI